MKQMSSSSDEAKEARIKKPIRALDQTVKGSEDSKTGGVSGQKRQGGGEELKK